MNSDLELSDRAVASAVLVARAQGIVCTAPEVLADSSNVLVHLLPAPVVARVATATALVRDHPEEALARELAMADYLARRGAPVATPSRELDPGPHLHHGLALSFWTYLDEDRSKRAQESEAAVLLGELHRTLRDYSEPLPYLEPALHEVRATIDRLALSQLVTRSKVSALREGAERVELSLGSWQGPVQPLHGDSHLRNLIYTSAGPVWSDFEDCCYGPVNWDLACLRRSLDSDETGPVAGYPVHGGDGDLEPFLAARRLQGTVWLLVLSERFPSYLPRARLRLQEWLASSR